MQRVPHTSAGCYGTDMTEDAAGMSCARELAAWVMLARNRAGAPAARSDDI